MAIELFEMSQSINKAYGHLKELGDSL